MQYVFNRPLIYVYMNTNLRACPHPCLSHGCPSSQRLVPWGCLGKPARLLAGLRQNRGQRAGSWPGSPGLRGLVCSTGQGQQGGQGRGTGQGSDGSFPGTLGDARPGLAPGTGGWEPPFPHCPLAAGSPPAHAERGPQ